jgi:hypothetical protein
MLLVVDRVCPIILNGMAKAMSDWAAGDFEGRVGEIFHVRSSGVSEQLTLEIELLRVGRTGAPAKAPAGIRTEPFHLIFRTLGRTELPAGLCQLVHEEFQPDEVCLVRIMPPVGMPADQAYYEAIFG